MDDNAISPNPDPLNPNDETHPTPDAAAPVNNQDALTPAEVTDNTGGVGSFGVGAQVWGSIGTMYHVVRDGQTTVCDKQIDATSTTQRLAKPPQGMLCGICLGRLVGA